MIFFPANLWAASCLQGLSSKEDVAEFCFRTAEDGSLDLEIRRTIGVALPLFEIEKIIEYNEKWYPGIDVFENYEIKFPEEWRCRTLVPLWFTKTFDELQEFFKNKVNTKLSDQVSHNCEINDKQINGRELEGNYNLEIIKSNKEICGYQFITGKEKSIYRYTKGFKAKVVGRCLDKKHAD